MTRSSSRSAARLAAVQALYQQEMEGTPTARLIIGEGVGGVAICVTGSPADTLDELAEQVARLAAWVRRHSIDTPAKQVA